MTDELLMLPVGAECRCFLYACALGAALGALFDAQCIFRRAFSFSTLHVAIEDFCYCIAAAAATFCFLLEYCNGRLRWYVPLGELLGWILFRYTAGTVFVRAGTALLKAVKLIVITVFKLIFAPLRLVFSALSGQIKILHGKFSISVKKMCQNRKTRLKRHLILLYNFIIPSPASEGVSKKREGNEMTKRRKRKANWFLRVFVLCFVTYVTFSLISMQVDVTSRRRQLMALQQNVEQQKLSNAETRRILEGGTDDEYIERMARDKLGYAYPDEKIFIDRSGG